MKKVIRLTESDLIRIVKRVISEETGQTLGGCITNYKTQNENWDKFKYNEEDEDDKFFLRRAYKKGSNGGEVNRIAIQKVWFDEKYILSVYSLPNQQALQLKSSKITYDEVKGNNCSLIQQKLDDGFRNFINSQKKNS